METFDDVLGHLLATLTGDDADIRRCLTAYDSSKNKTSNAAHLASNAFTRVILDSTIDTLKNYCNDNFPHSTPLIRSKMLTRTKPLIAEDICSVLQSITPTQCRTCKEHYVSTSADNTSADHKCVRCGRRSHKECLKEYTIDNAAGVVFLCDPCLTHVETKSILEANNSPQQTDETVETLPPNDTADDASNRSAVVTPTRQEIVHIADEICPLYKENSCPHGLTGKRLIDGLPCPKKHPPKCFYFTGKFGSSGCRYSDSRCPYFHPQLCENSVKLKMCLNKECTKYHVSGTKRNMRDSPQYPRRVEKQQNSAAVPTNQLSTSSQMWNVPQQTASQSQKPQATHDNGGRDSFLTYLQQMKADIQKEQQEMHQRMKTELATSITDILRETLKAQSAQTITVSPQMTNPQMTNPQFTVPQNVQAYHLNYPLPGSLVSVKA